MRIDALLQRCTQQLTATSSSPRLDCELLLSEVLQKPRSYLFAWPEYELDSKEQQSFDDLFQQRLAGKPVAYILGTREFWGIPLTVTSDTLIPRPETELLVEFALDSLPRDRPVNVLELGTGTGAIAIAIASELPQSRLVACDISPKALQVAEKNVRTQQREQQICLLQSDWFKQIPQQTFDLIISNPPYIADQDEHLHQGDVRFEPIGALTSGEDGLDDIRILIDNAPAYMAEHSLLVFEHGYDQGKKIAHLLQQAGYRDRFCQQDYAGLDRISGGQRP